MSLQLQFDKLAKECLRAEMNLQVAANTLVASMRREYQRRLVEAEGLIKAGA